MIARRKYMIFVMFGLAGVFVLNSVVSASTYKYEGPKFKDTELRVSFPAGWTELKPLEDHAKEFEEETGIKVTFVKNAWNDLHAKQYLATAMHSGEYDIVVQSPYAISLYKPFGLPLNRFIEKDFGSVEQWKSRFYQPQINRNINAQGEVVSWPFHCGTQFGAYRKKLFEDPKEKAAFKAKYGYELAPPTTYEELLDVARFFTRDTDDDGEIDLWGFLPHGSERLWGQLITDQLLRNGIIVFDDNFNVDFEKGRKRDLAIKVLGFWQDLEHKYKVMPPDAPAIGMTQMVELWKKGRGAMSHGYWHDWWGTLKAKAVVDRIGETGDFILFPKDKNTGGWLVWTSWLPLSDTEHPEACWEFLKWAGQKSIQMEVSRNYGTAGAIPTWNEEFIQKGWVPEEYAKGILVARLPFGDIPETRAIEVIAYETYYALLAGMVTPEQAVDTIAQAVKKKLKKCGYVIK